MSFLGLDSMNGDRVYIHEMGLLCFCLPFVDILTASKTSRDWKTHGNIVGYGAGWRKWMVTWWKHSSSYVKDLSNLDPNIFLLSFLDNPHNYTLHSISPISSTFFCHYEFYSMRICPDYSIRHESSFRECVLLQTVLNHCICKLEQKCQVKCSDFYFSFFPSKLGKKMVIKVSLVSKWRQI